MQKLRNATKEVGQLEKNKKDLEAKLKVIADLQRKKMGPVHILDNLSASTPEQLWLTEFVDTAGSVSFTGMAVDNQTIASLLRALSGSSYFSNVDLVETSRMEQTGGLPPLMKFMVKAQLTYSGRPEKEKETERGDRDKSP